MIKIKLTLKNGRKYYVSEGWPYSDKCIILKENYSEGQSYRSTLEFRVAWNIFNKRSEFNGVKIEKLYNTSIFYSDNFMNVNPEDVIKFEEIDDQTLNKKTIIMDKKEKIGKTLKFPLYQFNMLMECRYASCHWLYAGKKWIAFPKTEDYSRITKIEYYRRGLTSIIWDAFIQRNVKPYLLNDFYKIRKDLLFNETLYKIYLRDDIDSCARFIILPVNDK
jgi:hypothetical protein